VVTPVRRSGVLSTRDFGICTSTATSRREMSATQTISRCVASLRQLGLCVRFFVWYQQPRSRRWWSVWCIHMCRRHAAPTQAQVRLHWTVWRSNLPSVNSPRSCFSCCRCKGVERPSAKRCDISFVAGGVQEQAQDVLVPPLIRNCLTLNDTFFSQSLRPLQYSGPCNSVNCFGNFKNMW